MANIFYVDPVNGSNDNDGTTPNKAWASPFVELTTDQSSVDSPALIYVRRNTEAKISGDTIDLTTNPNRIIIGWPQEEEPYYSERPTAGTDAGWDDDDNVKAKIKISTTINAHNTSDSVLEFYNIAIETSDDSTDRAINYSIGTISFNNCEINHLRNGDGDSFVELVRIDETTGVSTININNCNVSFDGMLLGTNSDVTWAEVDVLININNSVFTNEEYCNGVYYCRASGLTCNMNVNNSKFNINSRLILAGEDNYVFGIITLNMDNSSFISSQEMYRVYGRYKATVNISDSYIRTQSNVVNVGHYDSVGADFKTDLKIVNTVIDWSDNILNVYNNYRSDRNSALGNIEFINITAKCVNAVIDIDSNSSIYTDYVRVINSTFNATAFFDSAYNKTLQNVFISVKNSSFSEFMFNNFGGGALVIARGTTFGNLGNDSNNTSINTYLLSDCSISGGSYYADNISINGGFIGGDFAYSFIDADSVQATISYNINGIFRNSKLSTLPSSVKGKLELYSCSVNNEPMSYARITNNYYVTMDNVFRVNGSEGSLKLGTENYMTGFVVDKMVFPKPASKQKIVFYFASQEDSPELFEYLISVNYTIGDTAYNYSSPISTVSNSTEEWSGLYSGYKSYYIEFELPDISNDAEITISLQGFIKNIVEIFTPMYIDLKPVWL